MGEKIGDFSPFFEKIAVFGHGHDCKQAEGLSYKSLGQRPRYIEEQFFRL